MMASAMGGEARWTGPTPREGRSRSPQRLCHLEHPADGAVREDAAGPEPFSALADVVVGSPEGREEPGVATRRGDLAFPAAIDDGGFHADSGGDEVVIEGADEDAVDDAAGGNASGCLLSPHAADVTESPLHACLKRVASGWMARKSCEEFQLIRWLGLLACPAGKAPQIPNHA